MHIYSFSCSDLSTHNKILNFIIIYCMESINVRHTYKMYNVLGMRARSICTRPLALIPAFVCVFANKKKDHRLNEPILFIRASNKCLKSNGLAYIWSMADEQNSSSNNSSLLINSMETNQLKLVPSANYNRIDDDFHIEFSIQTHNAQIHILPA